MKKVFTNILTMMMVLSVGTMFISCEDEPEPQRPDTPGEEGHWTAGTKPYSINVNPYNGDIIVNSDGDYTATGDCFIFTNDLKVRLGATELGMLPSKSVALDADHLLVLNEGNWGSNNADISYVDITRGTAENDWFASNNSRGLGDVGQDLLIYGSKAYATASFSNSIEAINLSNGKSTRISTTEANVSTPRYIAAEGSNIYVSCYSPASVIRIDTGSKSITGRCELGSFNPEGICSLNGKLYVASSNISDENYNYSYDNKVYVVDIASFTLVDSIIVGRNPAKVKALDGNHIVVNCIGDYASTAACTYIVDATTKNATALNVAFYNFDVYNGDIYGYTDPYSALKFYKVNGSTLSCQEILTPSNKQ
ncbi:MAG: hypothetical protein J6X58_04695 [Bacteroidales bacterium]|nr:hypothetical protein [Bacteroidales bacterium]